MNNSAPGTTFFSGLCLLCNFPPGFGEFTCLGSSSTFCFCFMLRRGSGFGFLDSHFRGAGEGWSWRGAHVWRGVVDYIGFPASGMIPENGSWTNIYSVADLAVFFGFPPLIQVWWGSSSQLFSSFWIVCSFPRNKNNILPWNMWNSSHDSWLHPASRGFEMLRVVSWPENHIKEHPSLS